MEELLRIVLPLYLTVFFGVAFIWRSYLVWKRTGINPYVVGKTDRAIDFVENIYKFPVLILLAAVIVYSFFPGSYQYFAPVIWLEHVWIKIAGLGFMAFALIWTATAQMQMGKSWRIGIDAENKTDLVEKGLFKVSRNPIFFGMRTALFGFFLVLPNAFTLLAMVLADVLMQIQVRLEEEHLTGMHGEEYTNYKKKVRRWI
ncbi:MAG: isoprenylcysteine carboxylmethyltransferase family protein [Pyrinomonadaceae bacterium]